MRAKGFYGHIENNHLRSLLLFAGFLVSAEIMIAVLMVVPIILSGHTNFIFVEPIGYFKAHGVWTGCVAFAAWALIFLGQGALIRTKLGYREATRLSHPRLFGIVSPLAITEGVPDPKLAIMPSQALNAITHGLTKQTSTIVVTQGLLDGLDDDELAAVMAHEIAHISRGDIGFMAHAHAAMTLLTVLEKLNIFKLAGKRLIFFVFFAPILIFMAMFFLAAISAAKTLGLIVRLLISSSRDFIADADAVRLTHNPGALISALRKIEGRDAVADVSTAIDAMLFSGRSEGENAVHATASSRIDYLRQFGGAMLGAPLPRKDTRAASLQAFGGSAYGAASLASSAFGQAQKDAVPAYPKPKKINLIDRVNEKDGRNIFGLDRGQAQVLGLFVIAIIVGRMMLETSVTKLLSSSDISMNIAPLITAADIERKTSRSNAVYTAIKAYADDPEADITIIVAEPYVTRLPERGIPVPSLKPKTRPIGNPRPRPRPKVETVAGLRL